MSEVLVKADPTKERNTAAWVTFIASFALVFDGYDLTIYGTVLPTLLADPSHIGDLDPGTAGALGSYAMLGVLFGALFAGAIGDFIGRRKLMLLSIAWFSVGMMITAMVQTVFMFGLLRFLTGLGLGALLAVAGATVAEFAPAERKSLYNAVAYCGIPLGGMLAAGLGILLMDHIGWRGLFIIGATPLLIIPLALVKLPESPRWLLSRGRREEAIALATKHGLPLVEESKMVDDVKVTERTGFAALLTKKFLLPTIFIGFMAYSGLLLTYGLQTWLPNIMEGYGYDPDASLFFLLMLNFGAAFGAIICSRAADKVGPRPLILGSFILAVFSLSLLTIEFPLPVMLFLIACAGMGSIGTMILGYGFVAGYYTTNARGAGVAWYAGFGRLGGVTGPLIGGFLAGAGLSANANFYVFAGVALIGVLMISLVRRQRDMEQLHEAIEDAEEDKKVLEET